MSVCGTTIRGGPLPTRRAQLGRELREYPRQFWVLVAGIFVYVAAAALAFPFEGIYLHEELGVSMTVVGLLFGGVVFLVMPVQFWGGHLTDRLGRRPMLVFSLLMGILWFVGFAFADAAWQVAIIVAIESSFGWPLFQTASNAMIADLMPVARRQEAYSITRVAMNTGVVLGPATAFLALGYGASYRQLFLAAAAGIFVIAVAMLVWIRESRPASALEPPRKDARGNIGFRVVLADRRFLLFCLVAVLPVFCFGNFGSIFSVYIVSFLGISARTWSVLLAYNAGIIALLQFPLIRATRRRNRMLLLAFSSALLAIGLGGSALAAGIVSLVVLVTIMSVGEVFLSPVAAAEVSDLAPEAVRGRYMGVWTVVWNGGAALGPLYGGWAMDAFGGREAFGTLLGIGLLGSIMFVLLARRGMGVPGVGPGAVPPVTLEPLLPTDAEAPAEA